MLLYIEKLDTNKLKLDLELLPIMHLHNYKQQ